MPGPKVVKAATASLIRFNPLYGRYDVLLAQAPFDNFLKAEKGVPPPAMRYPGEFRIPGGVVEENETPSDTALREVAEELNISRPSTRTRLFSVRRTAEIKGRRHLMYNYIIHSSDNEWVKELSSEPINNWLGAKKTRFLDSVNKGEYWGLSLEQKMCLAPEVEEARWWDTHAACRILASSRGEAAFGFPEPHSSELFNEYGLQQDAIASQWKEFALSQTAGETLFWNDYQRDQMSHRGIHLRDPMYQTLRIISNINKLLPPEELQLDHECSHDKILERSNVDEW
eukprot:TRINITY_DN21366_c0_g1_i1.p1 TRINITY_DN21366_c0_g1~~TRINITY_DN21366_c0_g1_i1.p1  ORF type:complete len:285 (+),score=45.01 TRINITY_DN21366_c0_g1_i1:37-891(+)